MSHSAHHESNDEPRAAGFDLDFDEFLNDDQDDYLDRCLFEIRQSLDESRNA